MLKFTAQLSDEFRRASSLSSLEAYHKAKQATKAKVEGINSLLMPKMSIERSKKVTILHPNTHLSMSRKNNCNHYKSYQQTHNSKYSKIRQNLSSISEFANLANYMTCPSRQFQQKTANNFYPIQETPRVKPTISNQAKLGDTCSTGVSNKIQQPNKLGQDNIAIRVLQPTNSLNVLHHNQIKLQKYDLRNKKQNKKYVYDQNINNPPTFRSSTNASQNINPTKMRISSINTLQNIQKRIQATLGTQQTLKI